METTIYFYTGTGNSLWTARKLSGMIGNTELIPLSLAGEGLIRSNSENIGFIFPVHIWGVPTRVVAFMNRLETDSTKYYFAIAVNAGQVAATLIQLKTILKKKNIHLATGFSICMPSNYIPWGGAIAQEKQQIKFEEALAKIKEIAGSISAKEERQPEKGPAWQNIFFSAIYRLSFPKVPLMDKSFWIDNKCTSCMICEKICPAQNVSITNGKPTWQHHCEQCFACLQWCPEEAIQYGKGTSKKKRYHHPEIKLSDMLTGIPKRST
ncbi:MAG: 4Fe-4S ferredoxin [Deltaproteobacteria bacterium HGW-Deltaproteobacteria-10]|jgi:ferredoxin|nr:MAG: 4Fe-4S ferredoxin [Deltaproteobacteria bacterium HGW-Deltaproteobacteria-2]PKN75529.1 MAG: 4Fe-4S ferredoxin [Deltaproteobacteria bacterium HGW-Deltaproteobacteria-10]